MDGVHSQTGPVIRLCTMTIILLVYCVINLYTRKDNKHSVVISEFESPHPKCKLTWVKTMFKRQSALNSYSNWKLAILT